MAASTLMTVIGSVATVGATLLLSAGCAPQPYVTGYTFYPQPETIEVAHRAGGAVQTPATVLVTVLGVRRADPSRQLPYSVAVRLRIENNGPGQVALDPRTLELVTGTLRHFPPPLTRPDRPVLLSPGQRQDIDASFPLPDNAQPGDFNLNHLRLKWRIDIDGHPVAQAAFFDRTAAQSAYDTYDERY